MVARYGERFIVAGQFVKYCHDLNALHVDVYQSRKEFERYVQEDKIVPVAVVCRPADPNSRQRNAKSRLDERDRPMLESYRGMPDREIVHAFDRQMETNILIGSPLLGKGQVLKDLVLLGPTCRYYSYWQVNKVYELRNNTVLDKPDIKSYNWLSYWIEMEIRERQRTFAKVLPMDGQHDGARILSGQAFNDYQKCRQENARKVQSLFELTSRDSYRVLRQLVDTYQDYVRNERYLLAKQIRRDALNLSELMRLNWDIDFDEISEELGKHSTPWHMMKFRSFKIATKGRDAAKRVIMGKRLMDEIEVDALLDYCQEHVSLLITALSGMEVSGDQDRAVIKYTNLKNILTSFEYLMKRIKEARNKKYPKKDWIKGKNTLEPMIVALMKGEPWIEQFKSPGGSVESLNKLIADTNLDYTAKDFLIACAGRNYTVHNFPEEFEIGGDQIPKQSEFYGDLFEEILRAAKRAILYTWRKARTEKWVD